MVMQKVGGLASCSGTPGLRFESTLSQSKPTLNQTILARISMWDIWACQRLFNRGFSIRGLSIGDYSTGGF